MNKKCLFCDKYHQKEAPAICKVGIQTAKDLLRSKKFSEWRIMKAIHEQGLPGVMALWFQLKEKK